MEEKIWDQVGHLKTKIGLCACVCIRAALQNMVPSSSLHPNCFLALTVSAHPLLEEDLRLPNTLVLLNPSERMDEEVGGQLAGTLEHVLRQRAVESLPPSLRHTHTHKRPVDRSEWSCWQGR